MLDQKPLFDKLSFKLQRLTDDEVAEISINAFGNIYHYYPKQIKKLVSLIYKKIERKNNG